MKPTTFQLDTVFYQLLDQMIEEGYISVQKHPDEELFIYNYTSKTQYDQVWNPATLQSRGLILDTKKHVVARPLPKFFNLEEHDVRDIPILPFDVYEKLDGSLGVLYFADGKPFIATRGSFASKQAMRATKILYNRYSRVLSGLKQDRTYLFEIIYPENRIVVDYGKKEDLIMLAILENETGQDLPLEDIGFPMVKHYSGINDLAQLRENEESNREGYVIRFENGFRVKVKFEEYKRLHYILTNISSISIWEFLKEKQSLDTILDQVPDEFYNWVKKTVQDFHAKFAAIENICQQEFKIFENRKSTAIYFQSCRYPSILFKMLDGKPYDDIIWRLIRPEFEKPFMNVG